MERRKFLGTMGAIGVSSLSGCISSVVNEEVISASPVKIPSYIINESIFSELSSESIETEEEIEYRGEKRVVKYQEWLTTLSSDTDGEKLWIRSVPSRVIGEKNLTPTEISNIEGAIELLDNPWESWAVESSEREYQVEILDKESNFKEYLGVISTDDRLSANVRFFYSSIQNKGDVIYIYGSVPEQSGTYDSYISIMQSLEHPNN